LADGLELAVILPTFCEADNVGPLTTALDAALQGHRWEAIFVDDNSPDETAERVREAGRSDPRIRIIERVGRRGLSSACAEGMLATAAPLVAVMDADLQHDPTVLRQMLEMLKHDEDLDIVIGSRFVEGGGIGDWSEDSYL